MDGVGSAVGSLKSFGRAIPFVGNCACALIPVESGTNKPTVNFEMISSNNNRIINMLLQLSNNG